MLSLKRAATQCLSIRIASHAFTLQPRCAKILSNRILQSARPVAITPLLKRFVSSNAVERDAKNPEEPIEDGAIAAAERSSGEPLQPETTSAAEFDASDIQPVGARSTSHGEVTESISTGVNVSKDEIKERTYREEIPPSKELFVGNLYFDVTDEDLRKEFSRFGTILELRIVKDAQGMSKGFAYVTYLDQTDATNALQELNQQVFEGRRLTVQYRKSQTMGQIARERAKLRRETTAPPSRTLYIGNMSFDLSDQDLSKLFSGVKNVVDVRVAIDRRTGQPRGFAHADFVDIESAELAFQKLNGKEVYGRVLRCDYSAPSSRVRDRTELR